MIYALNERHIDEIIENKYINFQKLKAHEYVVKLTPKDFERLHNKGLMENFYICLDTQKATK